MDEVTLKTAYEWADLLGYRIYDPDGWRGKNGRPLTDLIDREEFDQRIVLCTISLTAPNEQALAEAMYPNHAPSTALANYRAGHEVWDTNGDPW